VERLGLLADERKIICSRTLTFRIFSNSMMSFFWYAAIKFVIARISGSLLYLQTFWEFQRDENQATRPKRMKIKLQDQRGCQRSYGLASCPSKGFTSDSINILARTRYLMSSTNKL
jgi:hypothetical protein